MLGRREPPCVSVYLPTHRRRTEGRSDAILYRNLCRNVEKVLTRDVPGHTTREIVGRLKTYDHEEFWEGGKTSDGLCVFAAQGFQAAYRLPGQFPQLDVVGGTFHTKPLIRYLQSNAPTYYLLSLNLHRVALYEGIGDAIQEIPLQGVPLSLNGEEGGARGESASAAPRQTTVPRQTDDGLRMHYGQSGAKEVAKGDIERFFRMVSKELWKNHLRSSTKVLILAAPAQHQALFRKVAQIPTLLDAGVIVDPSKLTAEELHAEARRTLEPEILKRIERAKDEFGLARSRGQGTDDLKDVAGHVAAGRTRLLFVESGRRIWGMLNPQTGEILPGDVSRNAYDVDLLDELAELTIVRGGEVFILRKEDMPTTTGIAAILRF